MANRLKMAQMNAIEALLARGWSRRRIARELGVDRGTVSRYARLASEESKPAIPTAGSDPPGNPNPAIPTAGSDAPAESKPAIPTAGSATPGSGGRRSHCEAHRDQIIAKLGIGLSGVRIWQDLCDERGFAGSYESVKRFIRPLREANPLPFRRMECDPGEEAQVDFGTGAPVVGSDGRRRRPHVIRVVLSHSRKGYSEAIFRQTTEGFIRCLENAFWHFGGVPSTVVIDNLKAAVKRADWYDPELNPKIEEFCRHYGTVIMPTRPRTPRHKGKVERGVGYVQSNALKGRVFASLAEENEHLLRWESRVADRRIHGTTRKQVGKLFDEAERAALRELPPGHFPFFHEGRRTVHRDGHVEVDKAYYSVPPEYVGRRLWVRWDSRLVRVFNDRFEQIALHAKHEPGRFSTDAAHISSKKMSSVEMGASALVGRASRIGPETARWAKAVLDERGVRGMRVLVGLLSLAGRHAGESIEEACRLALSHGHYRLRTVRELLKRPREQESFEFLDEHPLIREMSFYGRMVPVAFGTEEDDR